MKEGGGGGGGGGGEERERGGGRVHTSRTGTEIINVGMKSHARAEGTKLLGGSRDMFPLINFVI